MNLVLTDDRQPKALGAMRQGDLVAGAYRLVKRIGSGGMGEVYAAEHCGLGRQFAVKLLRGQVEQKAIERFRKEARAVASIDNEYVVSVVDCGETSEGTPYLVMELLRGEDLRSLLARAMPLPIARAVSLICDACHGVAAVHRAGLVHRDLKPANLFVTRRATGEDWCKVLDFGVAKFEDSLSTSEANLVGTVRYMSPEQIHNSASCGPRGDIYALGVILYECLSGTVLYSGSSIQEVMFKIMNEPPPTLVERRDEVPVALSRAVARALAKRPEQRFASADEFLEAIAPFARGRAEHIDSSDSETENLTYAVPPSPNRWAAGVIMALAVVVCVLAIDELRLHRVDSSASLVACCAAAPVKGVPVVPNAKRSTAPPLAASIPCAAQPLLGGSSAADRLTPSIKTRRGSSSTLPSRSTFDLDNPYGR